MTAYQIFVQILGFMGTALFFTSFQFKSNRKLFRVQLVSYLIYTVHLLLLGAVTGGISYGINILRSLFLGSNWQFGKSRKMCAILCALQVGAMVLTWSGWISLLPVAANIASTVGGYTKNPKKVRAVGIFINSPLWMVYNILVGSWAGILDEVVSEVSMILSVARFGWKNLDRVEE